MAGKEAGNPRPLNDFETFGMAERLDFLECQSPFRSFAVKSPARFVHPILDGAGIEIGKHCPFSADAQDLP